eukprot:gene15675-33119_t
MLLWPMASAGARAGSLNTTQAVQLMNRDKAVVVDVSETEEFAAGHVNGAKNVPLSQLEERLPTVVKNKALPVVLVCATGARANRAVAIAKKLGYDNAQAMAGGLKAWREASLPLFGQRYACRWFFSPTGRKRKVCHATREDVHHRRLPLLCAGQADSQ